MQNSLIENFGSLISIAWKAELDFSALLNHAAELDTAGLPQLSAVLYQTWLSRSSSPYVHLANFNLGATLTNLGDLIQQHPEQCAKHRDHRPAVSDRLLDVAAGTEARQNRDTRPGDQRRPEGVALASGVKQRQGDQVPIVGPQAAGGPEHPGRS